MPTRFVLMNLGDAEPRCWQAHYCILSLMAHIRPGDEIVLVTDVPQRFSWFGDAIRLHVLSAEELSQWIGPTGYFFRALIKSIIFAAELSPVFEAVIYLDTDTIICSALDSLLQQVRAGAIAMDRREYHLASSRRRGNRLLWKEVGDKKFAGYQVLPSTHMWNTGVTVIGRAHFALVTDALAVNDAMLAAGCRHFLVEQIAMSVVLESAGRVVEINPINKPALINHYWGNKDGFSDVIARQLATIHIRALTIPQAVSFVADHPIQLPARVKKRWWHKFMNVKPI